MPAGREEFWFRAEGVMDTYLVSARSRQYDGISARVVDVWNTARRDIAVGAKRITLSGYFRAEISQNVLESSG